MREILFRGKRSDNSAWETGSLVVIWPRTSMETVFITDKSTGYQTKVDPSTVGQYTGLTDKNGKRIFEGDLLVLSTSRTHEVKFADGSFYMEGTTFPFRYGGKFTIIGNIHDNPELLGGARWQSERLTSCTRCSELLEEIERGMNNEL